MSERAGPATPASGWAWRSWLPDAGLGAAALLLGLYESAVVAGRVRALLALSLVAVVTALAAGLVRRAPGAALGLLWTIGLLQLLTGSRMMLPGSQVLLTEVAVIVLVAFGCARWGRTATLWLSAASIPTAVVVVLLLSNTATFGFLYRLPGGENAWSALVEVLKAAPRATTVLAGTALGAPWLVGLAGRSAARARTSRLRQVAAERDTARAVEESGQAREIAALRDGQARLARDVHDVVGHSLAVILAQAESAQYLPDDPAALKTTMATIAGSARASLRDVRQVLADDAAVGGTRPRGDLGDLVEGVRSSGYDVRSHEEGVPRPLPPELDVVAFRVVQEMLTNAVRHGRRDRPLLVARAWPGATAGDDLRLEVRNGVDADQGWGAQEGWRESSGGHGLVGMHRRLASVGGRLQVRREDDDEPTFTVIAWVPVRHRPAVAAGRW